MLTRPSRKKHGKLDRIELSQLTQYLSKISGKQINSKKIIVIHYIYYDNINIGSRYWGYYENFQKQLEKMDNVYYVFITDPKSLLLDFNGDRINWAEDTNRIIENIFFPFKLFCGVVVIAPDGNYISDYGENDHQNVIALMNEIMRN